MKRGIALVCMILLCSYLGATAEGAESGSYQVVPAIQVTNIEKSTKFYMEVFDLKIGLVVPSGAALKDAKEIVLTKDGKFDFKTTPGLILVLPGDKPMPPERGVQKRIVVLTTNVAAVDTRARAAGSEVVKTSNDSGRFLTDPDGYRIEVYQPP